MNYNSRYSKYLFLLISVFFFACHSDPKPIDPVDPVETLVIPHIYVDVDGNQEIDSKENYFPATVTIDGKEIYDDFEGRTGIRGRGNTTWTYPKKPYRMKLDEKSSLFGLPSYKNWILLAEYLDGSMLYNSVPFEMGRMLEIPYSNHIIPVELTVNGEYQGVYVFSEHKEVGAGRIDIGEDGLLLELDSYFDEDWQFKSAFFDLPVMVKFPKDMNSGKLEEIKSDFEILEALVADSSFPNNNYLDYFDDLSYVNYMLVYQLTLNREINHPKSTYINKKANGKYNMGILWDFDWGFGFGVSGQHYDLSTAETPLFGNDPLPGAVFFNKFMEDPHIQELFKARWEWFKTNKFDELKDHVTAYSEVIKLGYQRDHEVWGPRNATGNPDVDLQNMLLWLDARAAYIDLYISEF